eukprot:292641-Rhodomonas_salina.1
MYCVSKVTVALGSWEGIGFTVTVSDCVTDLDEMVLPGYPQLMPGPDSVDTPVLDRSSGLHNTSLIAHCCVPATGHPRPPPVSPSHISGSWYGGG